MGETKLCKHENCPNPRMGTFALCRYHYWEKLKQKKQERELRDKLKKEKKVEKNELSLKNLDNLWKEATKIVAQRRCIKCGRATSIQSHHIIGKRNYSVRWDIQNCAVLCADHHTFNRYFSAHTTPIEFTNWIINQRGLAWYKKLKREAAEPLTYQRKKECRAELLAIIKAYENHDKIIRVPQRLPRRH